MSIDKSAARMTRLCVAYVGNKLRDEVLFPPGRELDPADMDAGDLLAEAFLRKKGQSMPYKFTHPADLNLNEIYTYVNGIFNREGLMQQAGNIAQALYDAQVHPHIRGGQLFVAHFRECVVDGLDVQAVGIFKTETRKPFLSGSPGVWDVPVEHGTPLQGIDRGVMIYDTFEDDGYLVEVLSGNKGDDRVFWTNDFLRIEVIQESNHWKTINFLDRVLDWTEDQDWPLGQVLATRTEVLEYFRSNKVHDPAELEHILKDMYTAYPEHDADFAISKEAVREVAKQYRPMLCINGIQIVLPAKKLQDLQDMLDLLDDGDGYLKIHGVLELA